MSINSSQCLDLNVSFTKSASGPLGIILMNFPSVSCSADSGAVSLKPLSAASHWSQFPICILYVYISLVCCERLFFV